MLELLQSSTPLALGVAFVYGAFVGSFLNVVIYRLPVMMEREWKKQCAEFAAAPLGASTEEKFNLVLPRSRCPSCKAQIRAWHNIPIGGWLMLRGKCADCTARISPRYPLIELFTALLSAVVVWKFGIGWNTLAALGLTWSLIALAVIDLDTQLLPDSITLPLLWAGLLFAVVFAGSPGPGSAGLAIPAPSLSSSVIGAAAGYLSLWSVYQAFKLLTGKEGMGYGDFKLLAAFGAWFGWQMLLPIVLLSAFTGAVVGIGLIVLRKHGREVPIPFGPYLAAAGWIALMWGPQIVERYLHLARL